MALLHGITANTLNPDTIYLAMYEALSVCRRLGIPDEDVEVVFAEFQEYSAAVRGRNPLSRMF